MDEFLVTVYCLTYNHEKYIRKTLEGFVSQKTKFPFRIIIHDDASTDATPEICKEFAKKYPGLFYLILQEENQHSKKVSIFKTYIEPHIKSKYIAVCEGDDYWCDDDKLQVQVDYLENNFDCSLCVHNTLKITESGKSMDEYFHNIAYDDYDIDVNEIIKSVQNILFHLSSCVYRTDLRRNMPSFYDEFSVGDYPLFIYMALNGHVHYLAKVMSCYRVCSSNSWTVRKNANKNFCIETNNRIIDGLKKINKHTAYRYSKPINLAIHQKEFNNIILEKNIFKLFAHYSYLYILFDKFKDYGIKRFLRKALAIFFGVLK